MACRQDSQTFVEMSDLHSAGTCPHLLQLYTRRCLRDCTLACQAFDNTTTPAYCHTYFNLTTPNQVEEQYDWLDLVFAYYKHTAQWRFVFEGRRQ